MASNVDIVTEVHGAMARGDWFTVLGHVARDVRWTCHAQDEQAAPWFGVFEGKRGLTDLFAAFGTVEYTEVVQKAMAADGDLVMTWAHVAFVAPTGRPAETDEVLVWRLADGRIVAVDVVMDTAAVAAAFA